MIRLWNNTTQKYVLNDDGTICESANMNDAVEALMRVNDLKQLNPNHKHDRIVIVKNTMSDQPKTATDEMSHDEIWDAMHGVNQPKPTTVEWTVDGDFVRAGSNLLLSVKAIADAHNAALAAAVKQWTQSRCFVTLESYEQLEKQLDAEREEVERLKRQYDLAVQDCNSTRNREHELRTQLAAERKRNKELQDEIDRLKR